MRRKDETKNVYLPYIPCINGMNRLKSFFNQPQVQVPFII